jgi:hypothetical protein
MDDIIMKTEIIEIRKLLASDGMVLTNGEAYGKEIYLGKFDKEENWSEITEEEYQAKLAEEQEEAL